MTEGGREESEDKGRGEKQRWRERKDGEKAAKKNKTQNSEGGSRA